MTPSHGPVTLVRLIVSRAAQSFRDQRGFDLAAGLSYGSLLSFVPLVATVTILTSTFFGGEGSGIYRLIRGLIPGTSAPVIGGIESLAQNARKLSGWASVVLILSSLRMFQLLAGTVNALWGTTIRRRPLMWLGVALSVVLLGPVAAGVLTTVVLQTGTLTQFRFTGLVITSMLLTLLYWAVPAAAVRWGPAAIAGLVAGTGVTLLKWGFTAGVAWLSGFNVIYGSVSAIAIFMLALGFVWEVLLFGVCLAHAIQFRDELGTWVEPVRDLRRGGPLHEAVRLLLALEHAWQEDAAGLALKELADEIDRREDEARSRLARLSTGGVVRESQGRYALARPPDAISLYSVAQAIGELHPRPVPAGDDALSDMIRRVRRRTDDEIRGVLQGTSLADIARTGRPPTIERVRERISDATGRFRRRGSSGGLEPVPPGEDASPRVDNRP